MCWLSEITAALCLVTRTIKYFILPNGNRTHNHRTYNYKLYHSATIAFWKIIKYFIRCIWDKSVRDVRGRSGRAGRRGRRAGGRRGARVHAAAARAGPPRGRRGAARAPRLLWRWLLCFQQISIRKGGHQFDTSKHLSGWTDFDDSFFIWMLVLPVWLHLILVHFWE